MAFGIYIYDIRPSGHRIKIWRGEFNCKNASNHKKDILKFIKQLERDCPEHMKKQAKLNTVF